MSTSKPNKMSAQKRHHWIVQLQRNDGSVGPYDFYCNWDPEQDGAREAVENAAPVQAWWESGKKAEYFALSSELVKPEELAAAA